MQNKKCEIGAASFKSCDFVYFSKALFEGLIFGGKVIGLALLVEVNLQFLLCFTLYLRTISPVGLVFGGAI